MSELKFRKAKRPARLFHLLVNEWDGDVLQISATPVVVVPYASKREDVVSWTFRDLQSAMRAWLDLNRSEALKLWKLADEAEAMWIGLPQIGGTNELFSEWQDRKRYEQREAFRHDVSPDAWGMMVREGRAIVTLSVNRDSGIEAESNFETAKKWYQGLGESAEGTQWADVRYGHWAVGWVDYLFVAIDSAAARVAQVISDRLENDPFLDDSDVYSRESEEAARWVANDASSLMDYATPEEILRQETLGTTLQEALESALSEDNEYDMLVNGSETMLYRVPLAEIIERFSLEVGDEDLLMLHRSMYGSFTDQPDDLWSVKKDKQLPASDAEKGVQA